MQSEREGLPAQSIGEHSAQLHARKESQLNELDLTAGEEEINDDAKKQ